MGYRWVLFDADHTLFDFDRSQAAALRATVASHGHAADERLHHSLDGLKKSGVEPLTRSNHHPKTKYLREANAMMASSALQVQRPR